MAAVRSSLRSMSLRPRLLALLALTTFSLAESSLIGSQLHLSHTISSRGGLRSDIHRKGGRGLAWDADAGGGLQRHPLVLGLVAKAKDAKAVAEEVHAQRVRKFARSVDQVIGSTLSGYVGPWMIGMIIGSVTGAKGGFKAAMRNGVNTGNSWGIISATFCGLEVLSREIRGKHDKWNNMVGACGAGACGAAGKGIPAMVSGCVNFAGMSYLLDLLMERSQDPFDKAVNDPSSQKGLQGMMRGNKKK